MRVACVDRCRNRFQFPIFDDIEGFLVQMLVKDFLPSFVRFDHHDHVAATVAAIRAGIVIGAESFIIDEKGGSAVAQSNQRDT